MASLSATAPARLTTDATSSLGSSSGGSSILDSSNHVKLRQLQSDYIVKLRQQKELTVKFHDCLAADGGMIETSRKVMKNLDAAVVASRRPGYFKIYEVPAHIKDMEQKKTLQSLAKQLEKLENDLSELLKETADVQHRIDVSELERVAPSITSLDQWFQTYGTPKPTTEGWRTSFEKDTKIYGGTKHHRGFKTSSTTMRKGKLIK